MKCECGCGNETNLAPTTRPSRGWVKGEPLRFILGHRARVPHPIAELLWPRIDVREPDECWLWTGHRGHYGYGRIHRGSVPRFILEEKLGRDLLAGEVVRHTCDNPPCCNPAHLIPGTQADNSRDAKERGRVAAGERHGMAKLTRDQVDEIRALHGTGEFTNADLAFQFNISPRTIRDIANGRSWAA